MVGSRLIRALLTVPLVAIAVSLFSSSTAQTVDRIATATEGAIVHAPADVPTPERTALGLEILTSDDRGRVTLRFTLPRAGIVRIILTTLDGKEVGTLASGLSSAGENRLDLDVRKIPAGEYRCVVQTRDGNAATTLVITK